MLYRKHGDVGGVGNRGKILGVLAKYASTPIAVPSVRDVNFWDRLAEGEFVDDSVQDPLSEIVSMLSERTKDKEGDRVLVRRWGVWLLKQDMEHGLQV